MRSRYSHCSRRHINSKGSTRKGIYQITNKHNGKKYIGSSINVFKRWEQHIN
ncbi:GIY-YIG nuclease family protein, partial [Bacillus velezensis]